MASRESIIIDLIFATADGSSVHVMWIHSSAIDSADSDGSHASRPKAYQFACAKSCPVQFASRPVFATPTIPVRVLPSRVPSITFATVDPAPRAYVSESRNSFHIGARY